jgi:hypothetical protein
MGAIAPNVSASAHAADRVERRGCGDVGQVTWSICQPTQSAVGNSVSEGRLRQARHGEQPQPSRGRMRRRGYAASAAHGEDNA